MNDGLDNAMDRPSSISGVFGFSLDSDIVSKKACPELQTSVNGICVCKDWTKIPGVGRRIHECTPCRHGTEPTRSLFSGITFCNSCELGYASKYGKVCTKCPRSTFAAFTGSMHCTHCGLGTIPAPRGSSSCECAYGYESFDSVKGGCKPLIYTHYPRIFGH